MRVYVERLVGFLPEVCFSLGRESDGQLGGDSEELVGLPQLVLNVLELRLELLVLRAQRFLQLSVLHGQDLHVAFAVSVERLLHRVSVLLLVLLFFLLLAAEPVEVFEVLEVEARHFVEVEELVVEAPDAGDVFDHAHALQPHAVVAGVSEHPADERLHLDDVLLELEVGSPGLPGEDVRLQEGDFLAHVSVPLRVLVVPEQLLDLRGRDVAPRLDHPLVADAGHHPAHVLLHRYHRAEPVLVHDPAVHRAAEPLEKYDHLVLEVEEHLFGVAPLLGVDRQHLLEEAPDFRLSVEQVPLDGSADYRVEYAVFLSELVGRLARREHEDDDAKRPDIAGFRDALVDQQLWRPVDEVVFDVSLETELRQQLPGLPHGLQLALFDGAQHAVVLAVDQQILDADAAVDAVVFVQMVEAWVRRAYLWRHL